MANTLQNIELLTNAIPPVDMDKMLEILNDIGNSTERGGVPGQKGVGDMWIFADSMNKLGVYPNGSPRPLADQLKVVSLINLVTLCGISPASELSASPAYVPEKSGSCETPIDNTRKRASNVMLGLTSGRTLATLVGDINDLSKAIMLMNGMRDARKLIDLLNIVPDQVMLAHLNAIQISSPYYGNALQRSLLYVLNRLSAKDVARLVHYGTGIGKGTRWKKCVDWFGAPYDYGYKENWESCGSHYGLFGEWLRDNVTYYHYKNDRGSANSGCNYYRAIGPTRLAQLLNIETGQRMKTMLDKFGTRTAIPAIGCGAALNDQAIVGGHVPGVFSASEQVAINRNAGNYTHTYASSSQGACKTDYGTDTDFWAGFPSIHYVDGWSHGVRDWNVNRRGFFPEVVASAGYYPVWALNPHTLAGLAVPFTPSDGVGRVLDNLLYNNLGMLWNLLNCDGPAVLVCAAGAIPAPPPLPADCDIDPYIDANGYTNAVGDGGPAPN